MIIVYKSSATHSPQTITFVPPAEVDANLRNVYKQMKYGFIYKDAPTYEHLIDRLKTYNKHSDDKNGNSQNKFYTWSS